MSGNLRNRKGGNDGSAGTVAEGSSNEVTSDASKDKEEAYRVTPLVERRILMRLDVGPFLLFYLILIVWDCVAVESEDKRLLTILFAVTLLSNISIVLLCQWKVLVSATVGYHMGASEEFLEHKWTHALVQPTHESESGGLVPLKYEDDVAQVIFHDTLFRCSAGEDLDVTVWQPERKLPSKKQPPKFRSLRYPCDWPRPQYASWKGHSLQSSIEAGRVYGLNITKLALPTFWALLSHQLVAPFFIFQVFCVTLWSLDEYWYYAIFTLIALIVFESTVAYNRLQSLQKLHQAGNDGVQRTWVCRGGHSGNSMTWMYVPTRELVPGDIISLSIAVDGKPVHVPADILLLGGSAVCDEGMLTGESVPQLKQPLDKSDSTPLDMQDPSAQESILFGGTSLIVATGDDSFDPAPDKGTIGFILRSGFGTAQGNLLRTMAHSSHVADSVHTWDTFYFIVALVLCAFVAAGWVLMDGWNDPKRNQFRLILHVIIIVTSVVPPELPMELSMALTNSVAALVKRCQVYCAELNRIPLAGQVDIAAFDKTGTLTSDQMRLLGVRLFTDENSVYKESREELFLTKASSGDLPWEVTRIMAACQALAVAGVRGPNATPKLVGDPLERAILKESGFTLSGNNIVVDENGTALSILHRFPFTSRLKRMTVISGEGSDTSKIWALTKGAPETIKLLLRKDSIPDDYDEISSHHMNHGRRVLAMAYRALESPRKKSSWKNLVREDVESNLQFGGFLVLDCPLKLDSSAVIHELSATGHQTVMITGDSALTAVEVARQVGIACSSDCPVYNVKSRANYTADSNDVFSRFECVQLKSQSQGSGETLPLAEMITSERLTKMKDGSFSLCLTGDTLTEVAMASHRGDRLSTLDLSMADEKQLLLHPITQKTLAKLVPFVSVFARHTPHQKEAVVAAFNRSGAYTLYAGDGVNDVGALKRAHVGISILSAPEIESKQRKAGKKLAKLKKDGKKGRVTKDTKRAYEDTLRQLKEANEEIDYVELGDASVAAPFTSRAVSIKCCKDVIQQGRCTLVTMLQIYKILGVNCLVNAMVLSKLFLHGVKQGDRQLTILGILVAGLFFFVTRGEPLPHLAPTRPPVSVLCLQVIISIIFQFIVHAGAIIIASETSLLFADPYDPSLVPDGPFNPNTLNTCTFLLLCLATVNTFAINYRGRPFMKDLRENRLLYKSLAGCYFILAVCTTEAFPPLNDLMQLTALPEIDECSVDSSENLPVRIISTLGFPMFMAGLMVLDTAIVFQAESLIIRYIKS